MTDSPPCQTPADLAQQIRNLRQRHKSMPLANATLPIFIEPTELIFQQEDITTHKQYLKLCNPYDFPIHYRVSCNAPTKYGVLEPKGHIAPKACMEVMISHKAPSAANCNTTDVFRITMSDIKNKKILGARYLNATLQGSDQGTTGNEIDHSLTSSLRTKAKTEEQSSPLLVIALSIVCLLVVLLPTKNSTEESIVSDYISIPIIVQLFAAYLLGLITMSYLKSSKTS